MKCPLDEVFQKILELETCQSSLPSSRWMKIMQQQKTSLPLKVEVSLTKMCNQSCAHCSNGGSASGVFLMESFIDDILQMQPGYVILTGGEPLLHTALIDIIKKIKSTNAFLKICTNGSLLDRLIREELDILLDESDVVQISFDAVDEQTYKSIRGKDHLERIIKYIRKLRAKYKWLKIELHCVPSTRNINQMTDIYKLACALGADYFSVAPMAPLGNALNTKMVDIEQLLKIHYNLLNLSLEQKTKYIGRPYEIASLYGKISYDRVKGKNEYSCDAGYKMLYISSDGTVFPCVYMQHADFELGNISQGYQTILYNVGQILPRSYSLENSRCSTCFLWGMCHGGCIGLAFAQSGQCVPGYDPRCSYYV